MTLIGPVNPPDIGYAPITGYPVGGLPYTAITPFTMRDGLTFEKTLESLRYWLHDALIPWLNANNDQIEQAWKDEVTAIITAVNNFASQTDTDVAQLITNVNNAISQLNDAITAAQNSATAATASATAAASSETNAAASASAAENAEAGAVNAVTSRIVSTRPEAYGAIGDGVTDDTTAWVSMLADNPAVIDLYPGKNYLVSPDIIAPSNGTTIRGNVTKGYNAVTSTGGATDRVATITFKQITGFDPSTDAAYNTNTPAHWGIKANGRLNLLDVVLAVQNDITDYQDANYPGVANTTGIGRTTPTQAPTTGVVTGVGSTLIGVMIKGFRVGMYADAVTHVDRSFVSQCDYGFYFATTDGWFTNSTAMFCNTMGVRLGGYYRAIGNRIEWNARYGMVCTGENTVVGNVFDRNGWSGLVLNSGGWGQTIVGNYFSRNGVGGNGTTGRWGTVTATHKGYVTDPVNSVAGNTDPTSAAFFGTNIAHSAHIVVDYQSRVVIAGNSYRHGKDDSNAGVDGPMYIYTSTAAVGSTSTGAVQIMANIGENGDSHGSGGRTNASYSASTSAIAGGTDTTFSAMVNGNLFDPINGVKTAGPISTSQSITGKTIIPVGTTAGSATSSLVIPVRVGSSGKVLLRATATGSAGMAEIVFARQLTSNTPVTAVTNLIDAPVSSAVLADNDANSDSLTVTLSSSRWTSYQIIYAS